MTHLTAQDLQIMVEKAASEFRAKHPEVAEDAVLVLTWCYTLDDSETCQADSTAVVQERRRRLPAAGRLQ